MLAAVLLLSAVGWDSAVAQEAPVEQPPDGLWAPFPSYAEASKAERAATNGPRLVRVITNAAVTYAMTFYEDATGSWYRRELSESRRFAAVVGSLYIFTGTNVNTNSGDDSDTADIFDAETGQVSLVKLGGPVPAQKGTVVGQRVLFVGGGDQATVLDVPSWQVWTTTLSTARRTPLVAGAGQKAVVVGEQTQIARDGATVAADARTPVDIYDAATNSWLTAQLSDGRWRDLAAIGLDNRVYIAGGGYGPNAVSDTVDIYNTTTGAWSTTRLSKARMGISAVTAGRRVLFGAGYAGFYGPAQDPDWDKTVDVYDVDADTWTSDTLTVGWRPYSLAVGPVAIFAGGYKGARSVITPNHQADVYDSRTGTWTHTAALTTSYNEGLGTAVIGQRFGFVVSEVSASIYDVDSGRWSRLKLPGNGSVAGLVGTIGSRLVVQTGNPDDPKVPLLYSYDTAQR